MQCANCGKQNPSDAAFCEECGFSLAAVPTTGPATSPPTRPYIHPQTNCTQCGSALDKDASFCEECGAPVSGPPIGYRATPVTRQQRPSKLDFASIDNSVYLPLGISAGGALLLLISLLLPWQQYSFGGPMKFNVGPGYGWLCILSAFGAIALAVFALISRASTSLFELPFPEGYVFMALGGFSIFIALMRMLIRESLHSVGSGSIVAMVASIMIVVSGFLWLRN